MTNVNADILLRDERRVLAKLDPMQAEVDALKHLKAESRGRLGQLLPAIPDHALKGGL